MAEDVRSRGAAVKTKEELIAYLTQQIQVGYVTARLTGKQSKNEKQAVMRALELRRYLYKAKVNE
jgi:hypothetical protein